jgi:type IVB pilus formation R64 PilN family outer membrane protein
MNFFRLAAIVIAVVSMVGCSSVERTNQKTNRVVFNVEVLSVQNINKDRTSIDWNAVFKNNSFGMVFKDGFDGSDNAMSGGLGIVDGKLAGSKAFIRALSEQAKISLVTQQSSTTMNLSTLPVQVTEEHDYVGASTTEKKADGKIVKYSTPATYITGIDMALLPRIMPDGNHIILQVSIKFFDKPALKLYSVDGSTIELLKSRIKSVNQKINIKSGQTLIMDGFQYKDKEDSKQELVILITPVIPS